MGYVFILIVRPEMKRLALSNKGAIEKYLSKAQSLFDHHKIDTKIDKLKDDWDNSDQNQRRRELNKIDKEFT